MRVLAIDTALEGCSAAVLDTGRGGIIASETLTMTRGHAEAVMPLIARVMDQSEIEFAELDRSAVTTGPGSFTGLRVGISAARGIALAASKPAIGLSTLAGFAAPYIAEDDSTHVVAAIDARHDHVYLQVFGTNGRTLVAPRIATMRDAVRAALTGPARIIGSAPPRRTATARPSRSICARPTPSRRTPPACRADDRVHHPSVRARRAGALASQRARRPRDGGAARRFVPSRMERRRIRAPAVRPQRGRPSCDRRTQPGRIHSVADRRRGSRDLVYRGCVVPARQRTGETAARSQSAPARGPRRARGLPRGRRRQRAGVPPLPARRLPGSRPPPG